MKRDRQAKRILPQRTRQMTASALMCAVIIISTLWLKFPLPGTEVLLTTQSFFVLLCGQLFVPRVCLYTLGAYLLLGLMGLPVFSATQGIAVMATPSFGYLLAFPFAAASTSAVLHLLGKKTGTRMLASLLGILVQYAVALAYIAALKGIYLSAPIPLSVLITSYGLAFLPMDLVKGLLAAWVAPRLQHVVEP